jgi:predicted DNA-binding protein (MmcQ/YjbR family)
VVRRPPYVGHRGWIGVRLDREVDWAEIGELCQDAYRAIAPARLASLLDR